MNGLTILLFIGWIFSNQHTSLAEESKSNDPESDQYKRDLSVSYSAADIGSKGGTRVKTITVIKNIAEKKGKPLKIDPGLHKNEDWGSHFRDNFNKYGKIPEVPDIDDLFEFVYKKSDNEHTTKNAPEAGRDDEEKNKKPEVAENSQMSMETTTIQIPAPVDETPDEAINNEKAEKIAGDAEIITPTIIGAQGKIKSQSLNLENYRVREAELEAPQPSPSLRHYFPISLNTHEKFISSTSGPYNYFPNPIISNAYPNVKNTPTTQQKLHQGIITVTTPSGKTFDISFGNTTKSPSYIAPNVRRNQIPSSTPQQSVTSSQRPYVAPSVRKNYDVQLNTNPVLTSIVSVTNPTQQPQTQTTILNANTQTSFRPSYINRYKSNIARSRGIRY